MKPHKHSEVIKAWADGAQIQYKTHHDEVFKDWIGTPAWSDNVEYRIKPAEPEREPYPETTMDHRELSRAWCSGGPEEGMGEAMWRLANAALRRACDNGQIVTRAEFDRAVGDRQKRDMAVAEAVKTAAHSAVANSELYHEASSVVDLDLKSILSQVK